MTRTDTAVLYSPALLALAVELAGHPFDSASPLQAQARSRTCGSGLTFGCSVDGKGRIASLGMRVSACAVGQASAAIFAGGADGLSLEDIAAAYDDIARWLAGEGARPAWPRLDMLEPALPHPGRHEAILLPWKAAMDALSKDGGAG